MITPRPLPLASDGPAALLGDGRILADLLRMAGPATAPAFLRQIAIDLSGVQTALAPALDAADWPVVRAQTHILIAVAGTIGATRLHGLAVDLNLAAHNRAAELAALLAPPLMADLAALADHFSTHPAAAP